MKIDRGFYKYGRLQKDTHNRPPGSRPGAWPAYEKAFMDGCGLTCLPKIENGCTPCLQGQREPCASR